jgi:hypothetical protein
VESAQRKYVVAGVTLLPSGMLEERHVGPLSA